MKCKPNQKYWGVFYFLGDFNYGPSFELRESAPLKTSVFMRSHAKHNVSVGEAWESMEEMWNSRFVWDGRWFLFFSKNVYFSWKMLFVHIIKMVMSSESKISNCVCVALVRMNVFFLCSFSKLFLTCLIYFIMKLKRRVTSPFNFLSFP